MQQHHSDIPPEYTQAPRPPKLGRPPFWMIAIGLIAVVGSWLVLVIVARLWSTTSPLPRVALVQDMGAQPKYREQQSSEVFADGRADRPVILGTVARGELHADSSYYLGYVPARKTTAADAPKDVKDATPANDGKNAATTQPAAPAEPTVVFDTAFPSEVKVNEALLKRGQERFNIYCSPCHGLDGEGHGAVNYFGLELMQNDPPQATWTQVADLTSLQVRTRADGHIYNTINVGIRSMPSYGAQIPPADRWAIVAYVRALQITKDAPGKLISADVKQKIRDAKK